MTYNTREGAWYFSVGDRLGVWILEGIKAVNKWPLLRGRQDERLPGGEFVVFDIGDTDDIGREAFVESTNLWYLDATEAAALLPLPVDSVTLVSVT